MNKCSLEVNLQLLSIIIIVFRFPFNLDYYLLLLMIHSFISLTSNLFMMFRLSIYMKGDYVGQWIIWLSYFWQQLDLGLINVNYILIIFNVALENVFLVSLIKKWLGPNNKMYFQSDIFFLGYNSSYLHQSFYMNFVFSLKSFHG